MASRPTSQMQPQAQTTLIWPSISLTPSTLHGIRLGTCSSSSSSVIRLLTQWWWRTPSATTGCGSTATATSAAPSASSFGRTTTASPGSQLTILYLLAPFLRILLQMLYFLLICLSQKLIPTLIYGVTVHRW
jgi:hypothetical protein